MPIDHWNNSLSRNMKHRKILLLSFLFFTTLSMVTWNAYSFSEGRDPRFLCQRIKKYGHAVALEEKLNLAQITSLLVKPKQLQIPSTL